MSKVKASFSKLTPDKVIELAGEVKVGIESHPEVFVAPNPSLESLSNCLNAAIAADAKVNEIQHLLAEARIDKTESVKCLKNALSTESTYVENVAEGDEKIILQSGFECYSYDSSHESDMPMVQNLKCKTGDKKGVIVLKWDTVKNVKSYEIACTTNSNDESSWEKIALSSKSSYTLSDLQSGETLWFRVCAFGSKGEGAWSSPVSKVIP